MSAKVQIVNHTSRPLKLKVGHQLVFMDLATVEQDAEYRMKVDCSSSSTFREYLFGVDACSNMLVVSGPDFKGMRSVIVNEVDGTFDVHMVPRCASSTALRHWARSFWKLWQ